MWKSFRYRKRFLFFLKSRLIERESRFSVFKSNFSLFRFCSPTVVVDQDIACKLKCFCLFVIDYLISQNG